MARISLSYPDTGLTVSISVKNRDTGVEAFSGTMSEVDSTKVYIYDFTEIVNTDYVYVTTVSGYSDMSGTIYRNGEGLTIEEHETLFGIRVNNGVTGKEVQNIVDKAKKEIIEKVDEIPQIDLTEVNSKLDTIDIAKNDIINRIEETEKEICNDIKTVNKELKEDNVSTRQLIRQKTKKLDEGVSKLADRQDLLDKEKEDEEKEIESALDMVDDEEIQKALESADEEHEKNIIEALTNL